MKKNTNKSRTARITGEVFISTPKSHGWVTIAVSVIVFLSIIYLTLGTYSKHVSVKGVITTNKGLSKIMVSGNGTVIQQFYNSGDIVKKGDVLYTISTKRNNLDDDDLDATILTYLTNSMNLIQKELESKQQLQNIEYSSLVGERLNKGKQLSAYKKQSNILTETLSIVNENLRKQTELLRDKFITEEIHNQLYEKVLISRLRAEEVKLKLSATENQLNILDNRIEEHPLTSLITNNKLKQSINQINQQIVETSSRRSYTINSPIDGIVANTLAKVGEIVSRGQSVITILPRDSVFQAEIYIPSNSIGFIKKGQRVSIRYNAFPYQHFGLYSGEIIAVSKATSQPVELKDNIKLEEAVFKATIELDSQQVRAAGESYPLQVGMILDSTISLESRNLVQWILEPLYSLGKK